MLAPGILDTRTKLFGKILHTTPELGFCIRVLHSSEISRNMLRKEPYNLNQMSHDSAIEIIRKLIEAGVQIETCYIDTVGNPETYKRRLDGEFPGIGFVVESKADANYAPCSAGSVGKSPCTLNFRLTWTLSLPLFLNFFFIGLGTHLFLSSVAKVTRDRMIANWQFSEPLLEANTKFGSGYPSDPTCKKVSTFLSYPCAPESEYNRSTSPNHIYLFGITRAKSGWKTTRAATSLGFLTLYVSAGRHRRRRWRKTPCQSRFKPMSTRTILNS
jgi:ribonuclease HII